MLFEFQKLWGNIHNINGKSGKGIVYEYFFNFKYDIREHSLTTCDDFFFGGGGAEFQINGKSGKGIVFNQSVPPQKKKFFKKIGTNPPPPTQRWFWSTPKLYGVSEHTRKRLTPPVPSKYMHVNKPGGWPLMLKPMTKDREIGMVA